MIKFTKNKKELFGLILIVFSIIVTISLIGYDESENPYGLPFNSTFNSITPFGKLGIWFAFIHFQCLGYISIIFPFIYFIFGYSLFTGKKIQTYKNILYHVLIIGIYCSLLMGTLYQLTEYDIIARLFMGFVGHALYVYLLYYLGLWGSVVFLLISGMMIISSLFEISIFQIFKNVKNLLINVYLFTIKIFSIFKNKINFKKSSENESV